MRITAWSINLVFWDLTITKLEFRDGGCEWQWSIDRKGE